MAPMAYVYSGRDILGHILSHGPKGFESFDRDDKSLGIYPTQREAADALSAKESAT